MTETGIVVVGGGIAGLAVAEAVRRREHDVPVTLVCGEPRLPYDRLRLPELLATGAPADALVLRPAHWYADHDVRVRLGLRVAALRPSARSVRLDDGEVVPFVRAVLCVGSEPRLVAGAYALRDPQDCVAVRDAAAAARRAVVIGGGRRGLDAARGIAAQGCAVTVVDFPARVVAISRDDDGVDGVILTGGERVEAQLVVCVATRPQTALAHSAGLAVDGAIVVDDRMRTSAAGVLATGACARHEASLWDQAEAAADELVGVRPRPVAPAIAVASV